MTRRGIAPLMFTAWVGTLQAPVIATRTTAPKLAAIASITKLSSESDFHIVHLGRFELPDCWFLASCLYHLAIGAFSCPSKRLSNILYYRPLCDSFFWRDPYSILFGQHCHFLRSKRLAPSWRRSDFLIWMKTICSISSM